MSHEKIIRGGQIVDGTGSEPYAADVAVDGGRITRIGDLKDVASPNLAHPLEEHPSAPQNYAVL